MHLKTNKTTHILLFSALFAAMTAAGAFIRIPIPPVPITLQTLFIYIGAGIFGPIVGFISQITYIFIGLVGLPVFAGGGGISYIFQPQFGYLIGMPLAGLLIGQFVKIAKRKTEIGIASYIAIFSLGTLVIYSTGILYLYYYTEIILGQEVKILDIIWVGFILFLPTDIVKIVFAALIVRKIVKLNLF